MVNFPETMRPQLLDFCQSLIRIPSLSGDERAVIACVRAQMERLGFDQIAIDGNGSLYGIIQGAASGPTLLLDAHCDTVGVTRPDQWGGDPFNGWIEGGRLYGRGTSDMKGALAAMVYAAASLDRGQIHGRVAVSITVMEEVLEGIALEQILDEVKPDFVVIGESTDLNLNHGGRGRAEIQLEALGKPAHSSNPQVGINAIHRMMRAIDAVEHIALGHDPLLGDAILALTDIISDPYPGYSVIPGRCLATYDRRLLAGETLEAVIGEINALPGLDGVTARLVEGEHTTYTGAVLRRAKFFPAWKLDPSHTFVQRALNGLRAAGFTPKLGAYSFCTNAASSAGVRGLSTIGFGPSQEPMAHIINEYIALDDLTAAARGYRAIIDGVLGEG